MANTKSAIKRIRVSQRRFLRNRAVRSATRTFVGKARQAVGVTSAPTEAAEAVGAAIRALDRAAEKGVIHRNNAARRKSRLARSLNAAAGGPVS